jgi:chromosome segregation ATPase
MVLDQNTVGEVLIALTAASTLGVAVLGSRKTKAEAGAVLTRAALEALGESLERVQAELEDTRNELRETRSELKVAYQHIRTLEAKVRGLESGGS